MQVHVETINPVTKKVSFEIPADQVTAEIEKAYAGIQKKSKIQGFRPGKAPLQLIKRTYSETMRDEVQRRFYEKTLFSTLSEHKIEPIGPPTIESDILTEGSPFKYSALVEVMPEVKLKDYIGLEITKEAYAFNPEDIEAEIVRMQENIAQLVPVDDDATVEKGHTVTLDYSFSVEECPEETTKADDAQVEVGAYKLMPDFEDRLVGMKCDETRLITVTLPEEYRNPAAAGNEGVFHVTIKAIKRKELPELNDEFAQQFGEFENMEQLRTKMAEFRQKHELERIENAQKEQIIQALIQKNPMEVPQALVKRQLDYMLDNLKNRLKSQHMSLEAMGLDDDGFRQRFQEAAADKVRGSLLLAALEEQEKFTITEEDQEKRFEHIAAGNADVLERIREYYAANSNAKETMDSEIKEDKAIRFLLDNAVITEVKPAEPKADTE